MKLAPKLLAAAFCLGLVSQAFAATELKHWPAPAAKQLNEMIAANANKGNFAVFDMDNTSYRYDLEESLSDAVIKALEYTLNLHAEHYTPYLLVLREGKAS
ncbi:hypothetical protein BHE74_00005183 [Ensete ventricosum]|nr:hypothetical protein BHE74_00005183 [Ensete ventricosum]